MIRSLIIDDEHLARRHLARLLSSHPEVQVVGEAANGIEALDRIIESRPDVVFLDIEMPGLNAFEALAELAEPPLVVFATAYDKYAASAFDVDAIDYLLKPIQAERLARAIEKVSATLSDLHSTPPAKLAARRGKRIVLLSPSEVQYIAADDRLVFLYTKSERFLIDRTLAALEQLLAARGFLRVSRSAIVNLEYVRELVPSSSGTWKLNLADDTELDVSRERARALRSRLR